MATTTNYSWTTPDDTDLVKDGAAAIRTLGSSADTTVKNLNPGTTAGDIDYYTSGTAKARIAIGTAGQVLKVNSGATAPEWGSASSSFVGCALKKSTSQSTPNTTETELTWDQEDFDTDSFHSTVTNTGRITIPTGKGGKYLITASACFAANATGYRILIVKKNGTDFQSHFEPSSSTTTYNTVSIAAICELAANDYITLHTQQNSGGNLDVGGDNFAGNARPSIFQVQFLGA